MVRIRRFGILRTANVAAIAYLLVTLIILLPFALILAAAGPMEFTDSFGRTASVEMSPLLLLLLPLLYGVIGWLVTALFCLVYNLAAAITGGAEMQLLTDRPPEAPPAG